MLAGLEVYKIIAEKNQAQEQIRMRFWVKAMLDDFPSLKRPATLKSLDDCKKWFKDYKQAVREKGVEWEYCQMTLAEFDEKQPRMSKNQAYLKENSVIVNNLYKHYVVH